MKSNIQKNQVSKKNLNFYHLILLKSYLLPFNDLFFPISTVHYLVACLFLIYRCDEQCPEGMHGENCKQICRCIFGTCNRLNGKCDCTVGWQVSAYSHWTTLYVQQHSTSYIWRLHTPKLPNLGSWHTEDYKIITSSFYKDNSHVSSSSGVAMRAIFKWRIKRKIELYLFFYLMTFCTLKHHQDVTSIHRVSSVMDLIVVPTYTPHAHHWIGKLFSLPEMQVIQTQN